MKITRSCHCDMSSGFASFLTGKKFLAGVLAVLAVTLVLAVAGRGEKQEEAPRRQASPSAPLSIDCAANDSQCPGLRVQGDPYAELAGGRPSPFRGYADPSIRQDPATGRLWMTYSWLHIITPGFSPAVDTHLASSDDGGETWRFERTLWETEQDTNPLNGERGYANNEVSNILSVETAEGVVWYGIRNRYFLPEDEGFSGRPTHSFRMEIAKASTPRELADAPTATLAGSKTDNAWEIDTRLSELSPQVKGCDILTEPGLFHKDGTLYLLAQCSDIGFRWKTRLVVFATQAKGEVRDWSWRYAGELAGAAELKELPGKGISQGDLVRGREGEMLAVFTPADYPSGFGASISDIRHYGCRVAEIASLDPPRLARDSEGGLKIRAAAISSDGDKHGTGACAYHPASSTGVIMLRFVDSSPGKFVVELLKTGLLAPESSASAADTLEVSSITTLVNKTGGRVAWSRANNLIAHSRIGDDGKFDLWTMKPDASNAKCLTCGAAQVPDLNNGQPAWHPSGKWIVFQSQNPDLRLVGGQQAGQGGAGVNNNLWLTNRRGAKFYQLTDIKAMEASLHPHFSHDGGKLLWTAIHRPAPGEARWVMKLADFGFDGNGEPRLSNTRILEPDHKITDFYESHGFTPDDESIIFSANTGRDAMFDMDQWLLNLETGDTTRLTDTPGVWDEHGQISPDGKNILWASSKGYGGDVSSWHSGGGWQKTLTLDLWMMDSDGSNKHQVTFFNKPGSRHYEDDRLVPADSSWNKEGDAVVVSVGMTPSLFDILRGESRQIRIVRIEFK